MCRLFGMIGTPPLPVAAALEAFFPLCLTGKVKCTMKPGHLDGWGVSGYNGQRAVYFGRHAEPLTDGRDFYQQAIQKAARAPCPVIIAHLRKASAGLPQIANTHPFHHQDWIFAHNGTLFDAYEALPLMDSVPQGQTDSERFMFWMLEHVRNEDPVTPALTDLLKENRDRLSFSSLTFLMTDGKTLWAYRDYGDKKLEPGETVGERERYYTLHWARIDQSVVVCSEPLPGVGTNWQAIPQRTLMVFTPKQLTPQIITI